MEYIRINGEIKKTSKEEAQLLRPSPTYIEQRKLEYGSTAQQIEFIVENGLEAWAQKTREIKVNHPKPKKLTAI